VGCGRVLDDHFNPDDAEHMKPEAILKLRVAD